MTALRAVTAVATATALLLIAAWTACPRCDYLPILTVAIAVPAVSGLRAKPTDRDAAARAFRVHTGAFILVFGAASMVIPPLRIAAAAIDGALIAAGGRLFPRAARSKRPAKRRRTARRRVCGPWAGPRMGCVPSRSKSAQSLGPSDH